MEVTREQIAEISEETGISEEKVSQVLSYFFAIEKP